MTVRVGGLDGPGRAEVDRRGTVSPVGAPWTVDWLVGADDRWRDPRREPAVRQSRLDGMPVAVTALRVPGGDAVQRVWAAGSLAHVRVANDSPAPFALAWIVGARGRGTRAIEADAAGMVHVDGRPAVALQPAPFRWAVGDEPGAARADVASGAARPGPFPGVRARGYVEAAFLVPATQRSAGPSAHLFLDGHAGTLRGAPEPDAVARGWQTVLGSRGLRAELPEPGLAGALAAARAQLLLADRTRPEVVAALEDWGFDDEAAAAWEGLGWRARRRAARRADLAPTAVWPGVRAALDVVGDPVPLLRAVRSLLVSEPARGAIRLLAACPPGWRGHGIDVHDAPTRAGALSYAVRWHGDRAALLWEAPAGVTLTIPGLAPGWSTEAPAGEALLPPGA